MVVSDLIGGRAEGGREGGMAIHPSSSNLPTFPWTVFRGVRALGWSIDESWWAAFSSDSSWDGGRKGER